MWCRFPFNFIDCQALDEVIPLARQRRMGIIAMKPLGGGLLDNARLCFRYLSQFPDLLPDPGIERIEELREILAVMREKGPLTEEESDAIERYRSTLGKTWCHRCDYCQPCPRRGTNKHGARRGKLRSAYALRCGSQFRGGTSRRRREVVSECRTCV